MAVDGDNSRFEVVEEFARLGPAGEDGKAGTDDDIEDPLAGITPDFPRRDDSYYQRIDEKLTKRGAVGEKWQVRWYETEKIFARLDGGRFPEAVEILIPLLAESVRNPTANVEGDQVLQQNQDIPDRIDAALGVIYRARTGTMAGVSEFVQACNTYARYGAAGPDDKMGTEDDLELPL